jgi:hypothetical protein
VERVEKGRALVSVVEPSPSQVEAAKHRVKAKLLRHLPNGRGLEKTTRLVESGRLKVFVKSIVFACGGKARSPDKSIGTYMREKLCCRLSDPASQGGEGKYMRNALRGFLESRHSVPKNLFEWTAVY